MFERTKCDPSESAEIARLNQKRIDRTAQLMLLSPEEVPMFSAMLECYLEELDPQGIEQVDLIREIVVAKWREERYWGIEGSIFELALNDTTEAIDKRFTKIDGSTKLAASLLEQHGHVKAIELVTRLEGRMHRMHERARKSLTGLQARPKPQIAKNTSEAKSTSNPPEIQSASNQHEAIDTSEAKPKSIGEEQSQQNHTSEPKPTPNQPEIESGSDLKEARNTSEPKPKSLAEVHPQQNRTSEPKLTATPPEIEFLNEPKETKAA
jgi:hypothetical protein